MADLVTFRLLYPAYALPDVSDSALTALLGLAATRVSRTCLGFVPDIFDEGVYLVTASLAFTSFPTQGAAAAGLLESETFIDQREQYRYTNTARNNPNLVAGRKGAVGTDPFNALYLRLLDLYCPSIGFVVSGPDCCGDSYSLPTLSSQQPVSSSAPINPIYTFLSPTTINPGTLVTLSGSNFNEATPPVWTGGTAPTFTFVNATTITFVAPAAGNYTVGGLPLAVVANSVSLFASPAIAHGDSFSQGTGASTVSNGFAPRAAASLGVTLTNRGVGGSQTNNAAARMFAANDSIAVNSISFVELGYNDIRSSPNTEQSKKAAWSILGSMAANAAIFSSAKQLGAQGVSSGFSATGAPYPGSVVANTQGSTWTGTFTGPIGYLCLLGNTSWGSNVSVTVDGVSQGSISTYDPAIPVNESNSYGPFILRFRGLSAGVHTVVVTVGTQSVGSSARNVGVMWLAAVNPSTSATVMLATPPADNLPNANRPDWIQAQVDIAAELRLDGLDVRPVRLDSIPLVAGDLAADGIHYSDVGHQKAANLLVQVATSAPTSLAAPTAPQAARLFRALTIAASSVNFSLYNNPTPNAALLGTDNGNGADFEVGTEFRVNVAGRVTALRFWKPNNQYSTRILSLWTASGTLLGQVTTTGEPTTPGWIEAPLATPVALAANAECVVSGRVGNGRLDAFTVGGVLPGTTPSQLTFLQGKTGTTVAAFPVSAQGSSVFRQADIVFSVP